MKKILSFLICFSLIFQTVFSASAGENGLAILTPEDYAPLLEPSYDYSAAPTEQDLKAMEREALMEYSLDFWKKVVTGIEGETSIDAALPAPITRLRPSFALPLFGTSISLTGRKTFGVNLTSRKYKEEGENSVNQRSFSTVEFEQAMQLKMEGKIADRIFTDIDYDDQSDDTQKISVSYKGKGDEFVQSADFGDIELALPKTEFISFNKQLFGAKMHLKYDNANLRLIGSRTKGTSKSKQFSGTSVFERVTVPDKNYIRRTYYDLKQLVAPNNAPGSDYDFLREPILRNSEQIYINDESSASASESVLHTVTYTDLAATSDIGNTAKFRLMERGVEYSVDYTRNVIVFMSALSERAVVVVDFQNASTGQRLSERGRAGTLKLIKTENDRPRLESGGQGMHNDPLVRPELKTVYSLGRPQVERDNGLGNFSLRLMDANGNFIGANGGINQVYPSNITVDFDRGTFELSNRLTGDDGLYANTPTSYRNWTFQAELYSSVKSYFIEPGVVVQSETVTVDGKPMRQNTDYYIDYASGFLTFYNPEIIGPNSVIDVTYDTADGSQANSTLLGARFDYDFAENIGVGATVLYEGGDKPESAPPVNGPAKSITVFEADFKAQDVKITDELKVSASGEIAQSSKNENLYGYAVTDNFEDIKQSSLVSMNLFDWKISSNPSTIGTPNTPLNWGGIFWDTQEVRTLEINPHAAAGASDTQPVLVINYDFTKGDGSAQNLGDEVSIVYPLSSSGVDLADYNNFELTAQGEENGPQINVSFGAVDERSDNYYAPEQFSPQCSPYYPSEVPKTEDIYCRNNISSAEDRGWTFRDYDGTPHQYDPFVNNRFNRQRQPNGVIDTQDLDGNGRLDGEDYYSGGSFGYFNQPGTGAGALSDADGASWDNTLDNPKWATYTGSLSVDAPGGGARERWTNIKHIRISLKKAAGGKEKGAIRIAMAGLSGNAWQSKENREFVVSKNSADNTDYVPLYADNLGDGREVFSTLYGSPDQRRSESRTNSLMEQALAFKYDTAAVGGNISEITAQRNFASMDFSAHREFNFMLFVKKEPTAANTDFFMRIGTDANYQEIRIPLSQPGLIPGRWKRIKLKLQTDGEARAPRLLVPATEGVDMTVTEVRDASYPMPVNFQKISLVKTGVTTKENAADMGADLGSGEVWLDDIFLSDSITTVGRAYRADGRIDYEGWGSMGGTYKKVEDTFETPVAVAAGQDVTEENYFMNITRVKNLPITANYSKTSTYTPPGLDNENVNSISYLDDGQVDRRTGSVRADFVNPSLPRVSAEYSFQKSSFSAQSREDDVKTYSVNVSHTTQEGVLKEFSAGYSRTNMDVGYAKPQELLYNTSETTDRYSMRMNISPWKGANFAPFYSLSDIREDRYDGSANISYDKAMAQNAGFTGSMKITSWFVPVFSYNVSISEANNLTKMALSALGASPAEADIGQVKAVNRSADGGVSLTFNFKEIFPKNKILSGLTLSNSYKIQDADSWANVESGYDTRGDLWVRNDMSPNSPYANKRFMTLRDTLSSSQRWDVFRGYNFTGKASMLNTVSILNNFVKTYQDTEETGTFSSSVSTTLPDVVVTIGDFEKLWGGNYWLSSTNLKYRYMMVKSSVLDIDERDEVTQRLDARFLFMSRFDTMLTYALRNVDRVDTRESVPLESGKETEYSAQTGFNIRKFRVSPKFAYITRESRLRDGLLSESSVNLNPSVNIRLDVNMPGGIWLPFVNRNYAVSNRIIWNTNISYQRLRSEQAVLDNRDVWDVNTSVDYEFSQNLRLTISGGVQKYDSIFVESESYLGYNASALLTLQF